MEDKVETPKVDEVTPGEESGDKSHPESIPWTQYVGLKETSRKAEEVLKTKVETLEGQLKEATSAEDVEKLRGELTEATTKLQSTSNELKTVKEASLTDKRDFLVKKGVEEATVKDMSTEQLNSVIGALESYKPKSDMGRGEGADAPSTGTSKVQRGFESLHPSS